MAKNKFVLATRKTILVLIVSKIRLAIAGLS